MKLNHYYPISGATIIVGFFFLTARLTFGQSSITSIVSQSTAVISGNAYTTTGAAVSPLSGNTYNYSFGSNSGYIDNQLSLLSLQSSGIGYRYEGTPVQIFFRRVNNPSLSGTRDLFYYFGLLNGANINLKADYADDMTIAFNGNSNMMRGSDNLFANVLDGNGNLNNIERLDVVASAGINLISASAQGFALMERGITGQHDPFVVAVITSVDGAGTPTSYSNVIRVTAANYGAVNVVSNQSSVVLRRDNGVGNLKASTGLGAQGIGGVFLKFSDFGLADGTTVYGYSVGAYDFPVSGSAVDFLDYTDATNFPLATSGATEFGGIDMIALTGLVREILISGSVYNDLNGLTNGMVDGTAISISGTDQLYINLLDVSNNVLQTTAVDPDGTYSFSGVPLGLLKLEVSTVQGTIGNPSPGCVLPSNWVNTGERSGSTGTIANHNGQASITVGGSNITGIDFGIEQRPAAGTFVMSTQLNPGGTTLVLVPPASFSGTDPDMGIVSSLRLTNFPTNATSITIDAISYTSATFPVAGITIPTNTSGEPTLMIKVDPVDGNVSVVFNYVTIDNAGVESEFNGSVTLPFSGSIGPIINNYPATGYGTLGFEDLWPGKGDYDFNDLVIDYHFEITSNVSNFIDTIEAEFIIRAFGASFENGFGFQFNAAINANDLTVTGYELSESFIDLNAKGTEIGQSKPTIIVYDNAYNQMTHPGIGIGVNTEITAPYVNPDTLNIRIVVKPNTYTLNDLDIGNFNPFIFVNKVRSVEVHLPDYEPTDLADQSLFGTMEDNSTPNSGRYYKTSNNLPWAINIYETFDYPIEKQEIIWAHLKFAEWAVSMGVSYPDWYRDLNGYRNNSLIYTQP
ncbi:MAG: LruC domain-containing protein [Bacteroidales bacterium]|nr:LruC domain-containing protein [Bacteroidales bacterium]